jgi:hypothetical protein
MQHLPSDLDDSMIPIKLHISEDFLDSVDTSIDPSAYRINLTNDSTRSRRWSDSYRVFCSLELLPSASPLDSSAQVVERPIPGRVWLPFGLSRLTGVRNPWKVQVIVSLPFDPSSTLTLSGIIFDGMQASYMLTGGFVRMFQCTDECWNRGPGEWYNSKRDFGIEALMMHIGHRKTVPGSSSTERRNRVRS